LVAQPVTPAAAKAVKPNTPKRYIFIILFPSSLLFLFGSRTSGESGYSLISIVAPCWPNRIFFFIYL